jgi:hypothetical protein
MRHRTPASSHLSSALRCCALAGALLLGQEASAQTRTNWERHEGLGVTATNPLDVRAPLTGCPSGVAPSHGAVCLYDDAIIPGATAAGWVPAPDPTTINFSRSSTVSCFRAADFNYFQTFVNVPADVQVNTFTIAFSGMDDGSRVSIFNSQNPAGTVIPGSYVFLGGSGTTNLAPYVVSGEINRVVVTQVDDCAVANNLRSATVVLNGSPIVQQPCAAAGGDGDGDSVCTAVDNCPAVANPSQGNADQDGLGDACDVCPADPDNDVDGDLVCGDVDNCPVAANPGQENSDAPSDAFGDVCDLCEGDDLTGDTDFDGVCESDDQCVGDDASGNDDDAFDVICNDGDLCYGDDFSGDTDGDGTCDDPDEDDDGDGCEDGADPYPLDASADSDNDGLGDDCDDPDVDGDGSPSNVDCDDSDAYNFPGNVEMCDGQDNDCDALIDENTTDTDGDATCDELDACVADADNDLDGDGICGDVDNCPDVPNADTIGQSKIFVNNDEWTLTDVGYSNAPIGTPIYLANLTEWFTGGQPGNFLAYSTNFGLAGNQLRNQMAALGHTYTVTTSGPLTLARMQQYDALFLGGYYSGFTQADLIAYIQGGGNVYIAAGTGAGGAAAEAAAWNTFLASFGLELAPSYNGVGGVFNPSVIPHPVFAGVTQLYANNGNTVRPAAVPNADTVIFTGGNSVGLFGVYDAAIDGNDGQVDSDGDGTGDACDVCPVDGSKIEPGVCGCGTADTDTDGDLTADCLDACDTDPAKTEPGSCGCGIADTDTDGDLTADCLDACDTDPAKTEAGICGCGTADTDTDGDLTADCLDACDADPAKTEPGICGCGTTDIDTDGDLTADCLDACAADPGKTSPGVCGCGTADTDTDGDFTADCLDACDTDPGKVAPGVCGCGIADTDTDQDGAEDCIDTCPIDPYDDSDGDGSCDSEDLCAGDDGYGDSDLDGTCDDIDPCPFDDADDADADGVCGDLDQCAGTGIPESVVGGSLGTNRFAEITGDGIFDTVSPRGRGPQRYYTIEDTFGCSCTQIIAACGAGQGHSKFGCSISLMDDWTDGDSNLDGDNCDSH